MIRSDNKEQRVLGDINKRKGANKAIIIISFCILLINVAVVTWGLLQIKKYDTSDDIWSISMYSGKTINDLKPMKGVPNPVFTASNVTDIKADFVGDPFIIKENNKWYLFFEALHSYLGKGVIGVAVSDDMKKWDYKKIVLEEEFHLSYPYVFKDGNDFYMLPEGGTSGYLNLYKAIHFPDNWKKVSSPLRGNYADSSIFRYDNKWWIFTTENKGNHSYNNNLHLFYSEDLCGDWKEHPKSPIKVNDRIGSRSAGRVLIEGDKITRFAQDDSEYYGKAAIAFEITKLTTTEYEEKNLGIVTTRSQIKGSWNEHGMHQVDAVKTDDDFYIAAVDGKYHRNHNKLMDRIKTKLKDLSKFYPKKSI